MASLIEQLPAQSSSTSSLLQPVDDMVPMTPAEDTGNSDGSWETLPVTILLDILGQLSTPSDVVHAAQSCRRWYAMLRESQVWRNLYRCKTGMEFRQSDKISSVKDEVVRLTYDVPVVDIFIQDAHEDEILHVSVSHNGQLFCTTSKDGSFKVWLVENPFNPVFSCDMRDRFEDLGYTQYSEFNRDDTMLLISGVDQDEFSFSGQIVVFRVPTFEFVTSVANLPYDVLGCWFNSDTVLHGKLELRDYWNLTSLIYRKKVEPSPSEINGSEMLFSFANNNCSPRLIQVIDFHQLNCRCSHDQLQTPELESGLIPFPCGYYLAFVTGMGMPHQFVLKRMPDIIASDPPLAASTADISIDVNGVIVGFAVDPASKVIFLNVRPWLEKVVDHLRPPPSSMELEIRVLDMSSGQVLPSPVYRGHRANSTVVYFLYLSISEKFVASGAEDSACYIWDRLSTALLRTVPFTGVVNCATFLPTLSRYADDSLQNSSVLVSVSDDRSVKVSYSRRKFRSLRDRAAFSVAELGGFSAN